MSNNRSHHVLPVVVCTAFAPTEDGWFGSAVLGDNQPTSVIVLLLLLLSAASAVAPGEAVSLMSSNKLTRPQEWKRAYKEAKHCSTILKRAVKIRARAAMMQVRDLLKS